MLIKKAVCMLKLITRGVTGTMELKKRKGLEPSSIFGEGIAYLGG